MGFYKNFVSQTRKPEGVLGKMMVNGMNGGHAPMADWGMSHLQVENPKYLLEIGCGGGRNAGEVFKVLKDDGTFMIVNESDGKDDASLKYESIIEGMKCYTIDDIESAIISAGFKEVKSFHHESKPWITVIARK